MNKNVFSKLKLRLILLYTLSTSFILAITIFLSFFYTHLQSRQFKKENFLQLLKTVEGKLQTEQIISHNWLSNLENQYNCIIYIEDNGKPLSYKNQRFLKTDKTILIEKLKKAAAEQGIYTDSYPLTSKRNFTGTITLKGNNHDSYLACISQVVSKNNWQSILLIMNISVPIKEMLIKILYYFLIFLFGTLLLLIISYFLINRTLQPVEESARKQKEFIAAASHELRSPLSVFRINLTSLKNIVSKDLTAQTILDSVLDMEEESTRMTALVNDMLFLASNDAKKDSSTGKNAWRIFLKPIDMDTFLIKFYEDFTPVVKKHKMTLTLQLPDTPLPSVLADKDRLRQLLTILFENAFSYAAQGEKITLSASVKTVSKRFHKPKQVLCIFVADYGPGVLKEKQAHLFERFYRADSSRNQKEHYGLGLSIAAELASLHGGNLSYQDTKEGGATFVLELPVDSSH